MLRMGFRSNKQLAEIENGHHQKHKHRHHDRDHTGHRRSHHHHHHHHPVSPTNVSKPNSRQPSATPSPNSHSPFNQVYKNEQRKTALTSSAGLQTKLTNLLITEPDVYHYHHHHHRHRHPQPTNPHHKRYSNQLILAVNNNNNKENGQLAPPELKKTKRVSSSPSSRSNSRNTPHLHSSVLMIQERNLNSSSSSYRNGVEYRDLSSRRFDEFRRLNVYRKSCNSSNSSPTTFHELIGYAAR